MTTISSKPLNTELTKDSTPKTTPFNHSPAEKNGYHAETSDRENSTPKITSHNHSPAKKNGHHAKILDRVELSKQLTSLISLFDNSSFKERPALDEMAEYSKQQAKLDLPNTVKHSSNKDELKAGVTNGPYGIMPPPPPKPGQKSEPTQK